MTIPDYQTIMLPLLELASDKNEHSMREAIEVLADHFALSEQERKDLLPSGRQATFDNRVGWARTYLKKAGLLQTTRRGYFCITSQGQAVLKSKPDLIDVKFLDQFPEFLEFKKFRKDNKETFEQDEIIDNTPEEELELAIQKITQNLASELLQILKSCSPAFFEKLVVDLLVNMGYGGTRKDAGQTIGRSGDGGIDGIINEDRLGLDIIYIQAKRWENPVGRPEIQKFAGALEGVRARKGIFITASNFTAEAREYVSMIDKKIILIDGKTLAQYMIEYDVGVAPIATYTIKKIDSDYFTET